LTAADRLFRELSEFPWRTADRGRLLWDWSRLDLQRDAERGGRPIARIAGPVHDTRFDIDGDPANLVIRQDLERLLQQHGRSRFVPSINRPSGNFAAAVASGDVNAVRHIMRHFAAGFGPANLAAID
jgi:hypothetical protein